MMEAMRLREGRRELDGRVEIDDACPGGERSGGKTGRRSENKAPIVAAVATTTAGRARYIVSAQQPPTKVTVAGFAANSSKAAVQLPRLRAVNRLLGNLTTAVAGTHTAFRFAKCAHR